MINIPKEFIDKFSDLSEKKAEKHFKKYLQVVGQHLIKRLPYIQSNHTYVSLKHILDECGDFVYKKKRYYIWNEFKNICPFFTIIEVGSNLKKNNNLFEKNSLVRLMDTKYIDMLIDLNNSQELVKLFYGNIKKQDEIVTVPIDLKSLNNYIDHCDQALNDSTLSSEYHNKVRRNRYTAKLTLLISEFFTIDDQALLPMIPKMSPYGRIYYKGISLMSMSREVRRAVLGGYHQYDLNAAVYAIKLKLVKDILTQKEISDFGLLTYSKDYLNRKSIIREQLAKECITHANLPLDKKIDVIKSALTVIGFDAKITGGAWQIDDEWATGCMNKIIMNSYDRQQFIEHEFVKNFSKEQHVMTKIIVDHYLQDSDFEQTISKIKDIKNARGVYKRSKVVAHIFQHAETKIMMGLKQLAGDNTFLIHDALISLRKIPQQTLLEMKKYLQDISNELTIDHEEFQPWLSLHQEPDDDPRDAFVRNMYKTIPWSTGINQYGNYNSYNDSMPYDYSELDEEELES